MSLSSRVEVSYQQAHVDSADLHVDWIEFVILWRGQPGWQHTNSAARQTDRLADLRAYEDARVAAIAANHSFFGGGGTNPFWAELDRESHRISALGRDFVLPSRGSALVVLVDRLDKVGGAPVVIGSAVVDGLLPADVRGKTWTSGDTTFMIRPSRTGIDLFIETLKQDPAIAAFLSDAAGPSDRTR